MQIQLKQLEIEKALKAYITGLGIDLAGKTVTIAFTSGRKDNGLSADIEFEDAVIPGYSDGTVLASVPTPTQPQQARPMAVASIANDQTEQLRRNMEMAAKVNTDIQTLTGMSETIEPEDLPEPAPTKPVSLFSK